MPAGGVAPVDERDVHVGVIEAGELGGGQSVAAPVDPARRRATMRNPTATHPPHAAPPAGPGAPATAPACRAGRPASGERGVRSSQPRSATRLSSRRASRISAAGQMRPRSTTATRVAPSRKVSSIGSQRPRRPAASSTPRASSPTGAGATRHRSIRHLPSDPTAALPLAP